MVNHKPTAMALSRIKQDYLRLKHSPVPYITAEPLSSNLLKWHYVIKGPEDSPYQGGYYHGILIFPREFPFKPPSIYMLTPNGRFKTNTRLCLSISDDHPKTWNPTWSVETILIGLLSFMMETTWTLGAIESTLYEKQQYAIKSLAYNLKNSSFCELFPEICEEIHARLQKQEQILKDTIANGEADGGIDAANDKRFGAVSDDIDFEVNSNGSSSRSYSNLIAIISFAIFAFTVYYVIENLN